MNTIYWRWAPEYNGLSDQLRTYPWWKDSYWWLAVCDLVQAVNRQLSLEQQLQALKENEQALQSLQESLSQLDHTLTSYLTDRIDAFQVPQEAQVQGTCSQTDFTPREQGVTLGEALKSDRSYSTECHLTYPKFSPIS